MFVCEREHAAVQEHTGKLTGCVITIQIRSNFTYNFTRRKKSALCSMNSEEFFIVYFYNTFCKGNKLCHFPFGFNTLSNQLADNEEHYEVAMQS